MTLQLLQFLRMFCSVLQLITSALQVFPVLGLLLQLCKQLCYGALVATLLVTFTEELLIQLFQSLHLLHQVIILLL